MRFQPLPPAFHAGRRELLAKAMAPDSIAIIDTADVLTRGDFTYPFHPDPNFYYLTGIDEPEAVLVLVPGHPRFPEVLFLSGTSEHVGLWEGDRLTPPAAVALSGIKAVYPLSDLDFILDRLLEQRHLVYLNTAESLRSPLTSPSHRRAAAFKAKMPLHELRSATKVLSDLRAIKQKPEIEQIRRAVKITETGILRAVKNLKPGQKEYQLEADLIGAYIAAGAEGHGFTPIVAAGANGTVMHYDKNDHVIKDGDLVQFDTSAEVGWYTADISRSVPANGRFTDRQRAVYTAVYRAQQAAIALYRPKASIFSVNEQISDQLLRDLVDLKLLTPAEAAGKDAREYLRKYYPHISHHMGLDVHDTPSPMLEFQPGMVVTCEPGLYIKDEGIGVRIEDDILITSGEPEVLSSGIPADPDSIEQLMSNRK